MKRFSSKLWGKKPSGTAEGLISEDQTAEDAASSLAEQQQSGGGGSQSGLVFRAFPSGEGTTTTRSSVG
jgi:hypothetical protein